MSFKTIYFTFTLVDETNLELLRVLRNSAVLSEYMAQKKDISKADQQKWFEKLNKNRNKYYLVYDNETANLIGYTLIKNIDFNQKRGEPGTFLIDRDLLESSKAALFMITFLDYCYFELDIKHFFGNVLKSNERALGNYAFFRPKVIKSTSKEIYFEDVEAYLVNTTKLRKALNLVFNYSSNFQCEK